MDAEPASRLQTVTNGTNLASYSYLANSPLVSQIAFTNSGPLRGETTMTLKWIAERLQMGTWTPVTNRLYHTKNETCVNTKD